MFIAKLQRSIVTSAEKRQVLIYNQSRSIQHEQECTPDLDKLFGNKDKIFAKCSVKPNGELEIGDLVRAQNW